MPTELSFDVAIVGAGPSGLVAAILMAEAGCRTALVAPDALPADRRTTALLGASVRLIDRLGLLPDVAAKGAGMHTMRLIDDTGRLIRAPEVNFRASEIDREVFGYNIHNAFLTEILAARVAAMPLIRRVPGKAVTVTPGEDTIAIGLEDGRTVTSELAVAADGARSALREAVGIGWAVWDYPQSAVVYDVAHRFPHDGVSVEFHTPAGPFVLVPLPGKASSIVLVETPDKAAELAGLSDAAIAAETERRAHSIFGSMSAASPRQLFPLTGATADQFGKSRVVLVGEAGHRFPPIGAQGLNLSLRDVGTLAEVVGAAKRRGEDLGGDGVVASYDRARRIDVRTRTFGVDLLDRALIADALPAQAMRCLGLAAAARLAPIRQLMMREGLSPTIGTPRMMR
ncbi:MAG: UbiH/UbiF family hydroxylase [Ancalomicrobiaceae bacterium]|nr:UbiH/UbiF family hydroxylase [Ancalomicrobiaceae bacterium]